MNSFSTRDKKWIWHPFTQEKTAPDILAIQQGKGSYLYDEKGKSYLDLISSWWVNLHGHAHPDIAGAIYDQALQLEHVIFAGFTHAPAVRLCEGLQGLLPSSLRRFFFSDNGSTAVEAALKMAYQYWHNQGEKQKTLFLSFEGGYHGDTFGAMAVGHRSGFHDCFSELFFKVQSIPYPATWPEDPAVETKEAHALSYLEEILQQYGDKIAAFILEPLIQGASGMRLCRAQFIAKCIATVRKFGILVIFDEVMTGFGRTGTYFALSQLDIMPDFLCLSKGITGGFLPLALTVTTQKIYDGFLSDTWSKAFAHGHSYTANPLACAAAVASLNILQKPETQKSIASIHQAHQQGLAFLREKHQNVEHTRVLGTIGAFELEDANFSNPRFKAQALAAGLLLRPLGNTVYILPPYSIFTAELEHTYEIIASIIATLK